MKWLSGTLARRFPAMPLRGALYGALERRFSTLLCSRHPRAALLRPTTSAGEAGVSIAHNSFFSTSLPLRLPEKQERNVSDSEPALANYDALWLRDSCKCEMCVDPSSKQKRFQTPDIPQAIKFSIQDVNSDGMMRVKWSNDIAGFGENHMSTFSKETLETQPGTLVEPIETKAILWDKATISNSIKFLKFSDYMSDDSVLFEALQQLQIYGLVFLKGVPASETAVEDIGGRVGNLKDTLYGRTWDVKSVPKAKNVAYTNDFLGLHMDLLYLDNPPSVQLLHCIKNSCKGGYSMFSDSFRAAFEIRQADRELFQFLTRQKIVFEYDNDGKLYRQRRPLFRYYLPTDNAPASMQVSWSPPFQGSFDKRTPEIFRSMIKGMKSFTELVESPCNMFEYRLEEGDCVLFANRRVLHARTAFDISSGERWLKGAYLDRDVVSSRHEVLRRQLDTRGSGV